MATSFSGGRSRSTRKEPPTIGKRVNAGLDINVCPIPVKTDVGQIDLVSWLSDGTSEKMTVLPFEGYFL
jgi:hypothetical protein